MKFQSKPWIQFSCQDYLYFVGKHIVLNKKNMIITYNHYTDLWLYGNESIYIGSLHFWQILSSCIWNDVCWGISLYLNKKRIHLLQLNAKPVTYMNPNISLYWLFLNEQNIFLTWVNSWWIILYPSKANPVYEQHLNWSSPFLQMFLQIVLLEPEQAELHPCNIFYKYILYVSCLYLIRGMTWLSSVCLLSWHLF